MKALIVDDDVFVRKCINTMIPWAQLGFDPPFEADNGAAAFEIAMREKPDIVISDVKMPILNGLEFSQKLRSTMVDTYIIILSEFSDFEFAQKAINYGVQDYLLKPLTKELIMQLTEKIRQIVTGYEKKRYYNTLMTDRTHMQAVMSDLLDQTDSDAYKVFFDTIARNQIHIDDIKRFCLLVINVLFEQMSQRAFRKGELSELRRASLAQYDGLKNVDNILAFTETLYRRCIDMLGKHVKPAESYIQLILNYIGKNYADPDLSVTKIADYLHLSAVYVGALFKQHQGVSMLSHMHKVRICAAVELLKNLSLSITEISTQTGYITPDYFTKMFKKATGMAPSEYRNMLFLYGAQGQTEIAIRDL